MPEQATFDEALFCVEQMVLKKQAEGAFTLGQTVALDFDGPLHRYSRGWQEGTIYDEPAPFAREAVEFLGRYWDVPIFTARENLSDASEWLRMHGFPVLKLTNRKPPAIAYVDDRAVRWQNWPQAVVDLAALVLGRE